MACGSGVFEYQKYGQRICGRVTDAHVVNQHVDNYTVNDMIKVNYAHGASVQSGDSGAPVTSNGVLLALVTDNKGNSSKAKHMSDIYGSSSWVIPSR